jgi:hypothetical protein
MNGQPGTAADPGAAPGEIAAVATFLAGDAGRWVAAQNIRVNGGTG